MLWMSAEKELHKTSRIVLQLWVTENVHISLGKQMASAWQCFFFGTYSSVQTTERKPGAAGRQRTDFSLCLAGCLMRLKLSARVQVFIGKRRRSGWGVYVYMSPVVMELSHLHPSLENPPCNRCKGFLSSIWHHLQTAPHGVNRAVTTCDIIVLIPFT